MLVKNDADDDETESPFKMTDNVSPKCLYQDRIECQLEMIQKSDEDQIQFQFKMKQMKIKWNQSTDIRFATILKEKLLISLEGHYLGIWALIKNPRIIHADKLPQCGECGEMGNIFRCKFRTANTFGFSSTQIAPHYCFEIQQYSAV
uniref:Uncharacterized protein n=1 Tax=Romanomermis culicivorax TaxID=13658 RepID=A0A915J5K3_ROMCU